MYLFIINEPRFEHNIYKGLSDCNWTRTQNHLVYKRTINHLAKLAKLFGISLKSKAKLHRFEF